MAQLKITLVKSLIGRSDKQLGTVAALGLNKIGVSKVVEDTAVVRGMLDKVSHLVKIEEVK